MFCTRLGKTYPIEKLVGFLCLESNKSFCPTRIGFLSAVANTEHEAWIYFYGSSIRGLACRSCVSNSVLKLGRLSKAEANIFGHCSLKASL